MKNVYVDSLEVVDLETLEHLKEIYLDEYDKLNKDEWKRENNLEKYYHLEGKLDLLDDLIEKCEGKL